MIFVLRPLLASLLFATATFAREPLSLIWPDLQGQVEPFEDHFAALSSDQIYQLGMVARIRAMREASDEPLSEANATELVDNTKLLEDAGIDIDALLAKRAEITEKRRQRATSTRTDLDGIAVRMPGYVLPLDVEKGAVTQFLLVPWVGACIHTPPPPPNQIVYVETAKPWTVGSQWDPVWVTGTMQAEAISMNLYLVDGSSDVNIGYVMTETEVEVYTAPE